MAVLSPMPVGKQVFLLGIGAISTVMRCMTPAETTVKKAAVGGKKSPAFAGRKTAACGSPSPALLKPLPNPPQRRALKKSPFFMTKTENAYDL